MYYGEEIVEEVRSRNDIVSVISQFVNLKKQGGRYVGLCPFHSEKTPSFSVSQENQLYYCFGCGAGGNVYSFLMQYENLSFSEAVAELADRAGMTLPRQEETVEQKREADRRQQILAVNKAAATFYYYQLKGPAGERGLAYLKGRGLTEETIRKFGLGYSPQSGSPLYRYLKNKGFSDEILSDSQLLRFSERGAWDRFWNRVMFPILDVRGRVIAFGGRVMGDGEPKYLNSPETPVFDKSRSLYGLHLAKNTKRSYFLLCEGYMDVISLHQAGFDNAVASLGTAFTSGHASLIKRYCGDVVITYDSDGAGRRAARRAIPILRAAGLSVKVLNMTPYKDPDEFIKALGPEAYQKRIDEAVNAFFFELDLEKEAADLTDPDKKTAFQKTVAARLTGFADVLERENYLTFAAARYGIREETLREMVNFIGAGKTPPVPVEPAETLTVKQSRRREKQSGMVEAERLVINWLTGQKLPYETVLRYVRPEYIYDETNRAVADRIFEDLKHGRPVNPAAVLDSLSQEEETRARVAELFNTYSVGAEDRQAVLLENIRQLKRRYINDILREETDPRRLQALIAEKAGIDRLGGNGEEL